MATTLPIKKTDSIFDDLNNLHDRIMKRAFELFDECIAPNLGDLTLARPFGRTQTGRQLKHCRMLACTQTCQENHLAAREFQRVVMLVGIVQVDLPEPRHVFPQLLVGEEPERVIALDIAVEYQFGAG